MSLNKSFTKDLKKRRKGAGLNLVAVDLYSFRWNLGLQTLKSILSIIKLHYRYW